MNNPIQERVTADEFNNLLSKYNLKVSCCSVCVNLINNDWEKVSKALFDYIDYAAKIGSKFVHHTIFPTLDINENSPSYDDVFNAVFDKAIAIAKHCKKRGITCLYEPQGMYFNGVEGLRKILNKVKEHCDNVALCGDTANSLFVNVSSNEIYDNFINDIKHVHVKDYIVGEPHSKDDEPYFSCTGIPLKDCKLGCGVADFDYLFNKLKAANYDGAISFELSGDDKTMLEAIEFVKKHINT